jgi:hypothetical protein
LLGELTGDSATSGGADPVQRKEVDTDAKITGSQDWTRHDRESNSARWQAACLRNLDAVDSGQYVKVVERRDFYRWFYDYSTSLKFTTRWALAAYIVASGAHQIADMDEEPRSQTRASGWPMSNCRARCARATRSSSTTSCPSSRS